MQNEITLPEEWKENFRMSKQTFDVLCREVGPYIAGKITHLRTPISVEKQIAVTLYYLSDGGRMRKTGNTFGIAQCTVSIIVKRVTRAISINLAGTYVKAPSTEEKKKSIHLQPANIFGRYGFPPVYRCSRRDTYSNKKTERRPNIICKQKRIP